MEARREGAKEKNAFLRPRWRRKKSREGLSVLFR